MRCKLCGREYQKGFKEFCSQACFESDIQKRITDATIKDPSHTKKISTD